MTDTNVSFIIAYCLLKVNSVNNILSYIATMIRKNKIITGIHNLVIMVHFVKSKQMCGYFWIFEGSVCEMWIVKGLWVMGNKEYRTCRN